MAVIEISKIQVRRGQENQTGVPPLDGGEFAWAADTENLYIGLRRDDGGARDAKESLQKMILGIFSVPVIQLLQNLILIEQIVILPLRPFILQVQPQPLLEQLAKD